MSILCFFHVTNLQDQVTPTDFYRCLEQLSCGDGLSNLPVSDLSFKAQGCYSSCLGSSRAMDAHGEGMETYKNGKACWPWPWSGRDKRNTPGRTIDPMLCMSSSQHKSPSQLGTETCRNPVKFNKFVFFYEMNLRNEFTHFRWLYSCFLAEDANFKQKACACSNINKDPPLGPGWGTFVENEKYLQYREYHG